LRPYRRKERRHVKYPLPLHIGHSTLTTGAI
jgi:hypothetical protein